MRCSKRELSGFNKYRTFSTYFLKQTVAIRDKDVTRLVHSVAGASPIIKEQQKCTSFLTAYVSSSFVLREICTNFTKYQASSQGETRVTIRDRMFEEMKDKDKITFHEAIDIFQTRGGHRRGQVEFICSALKHMKEFGVHKDLETYKKLLDIFPKGKMISKNMFQMEFMHFPHHQQCTIDLLDQMEENGVCPDRETGEIIINIFGKWSFPSRKYMRMMYWMPKFKNLSPWPVPKTLPRDTLYLAKIALTRIASADLETELTVFETKEVKDAVDPTWIVSAQSPTQRDIIKNIPSSKSLYVEGAYSVYLRHHRISYFMLHTDTDQSVLNPVLQDLDDTSDIKVYMSEPQEVVTKQLIVPPSVHEQEEGTVLGLCATGTSSRDSLLSWIRFLQTTNPRLKDLPVLFRLRAPFTGLVPQQENKSDRQVSTEKKPDSLR